MSTGNKTENKLVWIWKPYLPQRTDTNLKLDLRGQAEDLSRSIIDTLGENGIKATVRGNKIRAYGPKNEMYVVTVGVEFTNEKMKLYAEEEAILPESAFHKVKDAPRWVKSLTKTESIL